MTAWVHNFLTLHWVSSVHSSFFTPLSAVTWLPACMDRTLSWAEIYHHNLILSKTQPKNFISKQSLLLRHSITKIIPSLMLDQFSHPFALALAVNVPPSLTISQSPWLYDVYNDGVKIVAQLSEIHCFVVSGVYFCDLPEFLTRASG